MPFYTLYTFYIVQTFSVYSVCSLVHPPYLPIYYPLVPEPLPEVPTETGNAVKEAELTKIAETIKQKGSNQ